ncbi:peptidoglycan/LPS O-acetylase OafA/YrhL [Arthrobacter sp. CAN_A214]|uniref:acyltransferase family protein n=1 Tax=Arthrobacter sp. CAN_A214 TaxID=2787720 RepID=UPI001A19A340
MTIAGIDTHDRVARAPSTPVDSRFRPEVQGLRALAVFMVVIYHVWLGRVSGGVDVFLLISAFLLTISFTRKIESGKPLQLLAYWLGLFKRLLPGVVVVLLAVLAATALVVPSSRWASLLDQTWASLLYVQNWQLAGNAVDYYALDNSAASPLQHFWSLSIQGQVFLLWPLIFAASALAATALGRSVRTILVVPFGAVFASSLAFSIWQTATNQAAAYFDTRARLWEFALGSLVALLLPYLRASVPVRVMLGWIGLAAMLSCGLVLQVQQQFPGYIALWPLLAAACIIGAGRTGSRYGVDRLLASAPLVRMGNNSYALYLWHWPVLVIWLVVAEKPAAGPLDGTAVIAASLLLASATTRFIETPVRSWRWPLARRRRTGLVVAAALAVVVVPLSGWEYRVQAQEKAVEQQTILDNPGALALAPDFSFLGAPDALIKPTTSRLGAEWAAVDGECEGGRAPSDPLLDSCAYSGNAETPERTVLVIGDSHSQMWMTAVGAIAKNNNWNAVSLHKPNCRFAVESEEEDPECNAFNAAVLGYALTLAPDAVVTVGSKTEWSSPEETLAAGFAEGVQPLLDQGIAVVALRDSPRFEFDMAECTAENALDHTACALPRDQLMAAESPLAALAETEPRIGVLDMTDQLCIESSCPGVIGNVRVYIDRDHLSRTYVATTVPVFEARFRALTGW